MPYIPVLDVIALGLFLTAWLGYSAYADTVAQERRPIAVIMNDYRLRWMERMLERENRMPDVNIAVSFVRVAMMFGSTSILLLAGSLAMLGQIESVREIIGGLAYARPASRILMEIQLFSLTSIFVYAFFKFVWAVRLFNNMLILLGAAPQPSDCDDAVRAAYPKHMARFLERASLNLNRGMRAFTFGLALLPWLLHPFLLIASTVIVITVVHRRDFRSVSVEVLEDLRRHDNESAGG